MEHASAHPAGSVNSVLKNVRMVNSGSTANLIAYVVEILFVISVTVVARAKLAGEVINVIYVALVGLSVLDAMLIVHATGAKQTAAIT